MVTLITPLALASVTLSAGAVLLLMVLPFHLTVHAKILLCCQPTAYGVAKENKAILLMSLFILNRVLLFRDYINLSL